MVKSKKKVVGNRGIELNAPEVISHDELALFTDEDLARRFSQLDSERVRAGDSALPWEVEIAYIQREQGIRERGRQIHLEYMKGPGAEHHEEA